MCCFTSVFRLSELWSLRNASSVPYYGEQNTGKRTSHLGRSVLRLCHDVVFLWLGGVRGFPRTYMPFVSIFCSTRTLVARYPFDVCAYIAISWFKRAARPNRARAPVESWLPYQWTCGLVDFIPRIRVRCSVIRQGYCLARCAMR